MTLSLVFQLKHCDRERLNRCKPSHPHEVDTKWDYIWMRGRQHSDTNQDFSSDVLTHRTHISIKRNNPSARAFYICTTLYQLKMTHKSKNDTQVWHHNNIGMEEWRRVNIDVEYLLLRCNIQWDWSCDVHYEVASANQLGYKNDIPREIFAYTIYVRNSWYNVYTSNVKDKTDSHSIKQSRRGGSPRCWDASRRHSHFVLPPRA